MRRYDVIFLQEIRDEGDDILQVLKSGLNTKYIFGFWAHMVTFGHLSLPWSWHCKNGTNAWKKSKNGTL